MVSALIVEDNITFRQSLREILHEHFPHLVVGEATTGKDALQKVEAWRPELVFMDIKLPGENGLEVTKKIKRDYPQTVIAILTSYDLPEYRHAAKVFGANYYLCKNSPSEEILQLVKDVLAQGDNKSGEER